MKLLFITSTRVGDAVLSTGLLHHLLAQADRPSVTVACGRAPASLFAHVPGLDRVLVMERRRRGRHWWDLWRSTVGQAWDRVVDLRGSAFAYAVRAGRRHVWRGGRHLGPEHKVRQLARLFGLEPPPPPALWVSAADRIRAAAVIPDRPVLAVGPTANWIGKQWPHDRLAAVVGRLTGPGGALAGAAVAVFAAPHERAAAQPFLERVPDAIDAIDLGDLTAVGAAIARCRLFIGNDSGLMHLAAATGVPTLGLFGPSDDRIYGPWGARTAAVRTPIVYPEHFHILERDPGQLTHLMDGLTVDAATDAAVALLAQAPSRSSEPR